MKGVYIMKTIEQVKTFTNKSVSGETWNSIRHCKDVKSISMLGINDPKLGVKHEIIFNNKSSVFVYLK